jgi:hypothetical protein
VLDGLLTAGGLAGIALLMADPRAPLFLYVIRLPRSSAGVP